MKVRNNYNNCLTNLACSIQNYFGENPKHKTLDFIDKILEKEKPKKVVLILLDGLGLNILERTLSGDSFFRKNLTKGITSVFPATTTATTTSIRTGLNPVEHGWLGWTMYIKPLNKIITLFPGFEKSKDGEVCKEYLKFKPSFEPKTIPKQINESGIHIAAEIFPFGEDGYKNFDEMLERIKASKAEYIYAYDDNIDQTMHHFGPDDIRAKKLIFERDEKIEKLCASLKNTLVIITADHGHTKIEHIFLNEYPELLSLLERTTSLEQRATSFKIKSGKESEFEELFDKFFSQYFSLYNKEEIIKSKLFGDGEPHELFESALGDYIAIAENSNKAFITDGEELSASEHAGYTDDEILVPIIIKMCR